MNPQASPIQRVGDFVHRHMFPVAIVGSISLLFLLGSGLRAVGYRPSGDQEKAQLHQTFVPSEKAKSDLQKSVDGVLKSTVDLNKAVTGGN